MTINSKHTNRMLLAVTVIIPTGTTSFFITESNEQERKCSWNCTYIYIENISIYPLPSCSRRWPLRLSVFSSCQVKVYMNTSLNTSSRVSLPDKLLIFLFWFPWTGKNSLSCWRNTDLMAAQDPHATLPYNKVGQVTPPPSTMSNSI